LPLIREGFNLTKREFHGALCLRYGWIPRNIPNECVCGGSFNIDHALSCKTGGFINLRHNELRDITADLLSTVCNDVCKEPSLSNDNDDEELRADVSAGGVWQHKQRAFFDVRVFYPFAPSYRNTTCFKSMEKIKKRKYNDKEIQKGNRTFVNFYVEWWNEQRDKDFLQTPVKHD